MAVVPSTLYYKNSTRFTTANFIKKGENDE